MAEAIIHLLLGHSESQLDLAYQKRVLELEINQDVSRGFIQFILYPDHFEILLFLKDLGVNPVNLLFGSHALAPQHIRNIECYEVYC